MAKHLLGNNDVRVSVPSKHGTALHLAIIKGHWYICKQLIKHRMLEPNVKDSSGNTVLHLLFNIFEQEKLTATKLCEELLALPTCNPNEKNAEGLTVLHCAAKRNQTAAIRFALEVNRTRRSPFDFQAAGGKQGFTVLHFLAIYADVELINEVLQTNVNVFATDFSGRTARDVVKSSVIGKVLLRCEKAVGKRCFGCGSEVSSGAGRKCCTAMSLDTVVPEAINRAALSYDREEIKHEIDNNDLEESGFSSRRRTYKKPTPLLSSTQRIDSESENITEKFFIQQEFKNVDMYCSGLNNCLRKETNELSTERVFTTTFKHPNLIAELTLEDSLNSQFSLEDNFCYLYGAIVNETVSRPLQYCYLYHIFRKHNSASEETLRLLCDKLIKLSLIHICRCRRYAVCRSRWSPYH
eukprot:TRINITY_DN4164_c0_g2_i2.p1 TRINITY_DN4164_c0_g2~~TRINITY_DN4164_c0_g2_i2.p1  ORF type:complete len:451 (-),score=61.18 TRINITY_DN4164_c0_g2_i2:22-1251(-)